MNLSDAKLCLEMIISLKHENDLLQQEIESQRRENNALKDQNRSFKSERDYFKASYDLANCSFKLQSNTVKELEADARVRSFGVNREGDPDLTATETLG